MRKDMEVAKDAFLTNIGTVIKKHRIKNNRSQDYLAAELNIDRSSIAKYESGTTDIKASTLFYISRALGFPLSEYMYDAKATRLPGDKPIPLDDVFKGLPIIVDEQKDKDKKSKTVKAQSINKKTAPKKSPRPDLVYPEEGWVMIPKRESIYPIELVTQKESSEICMELKVQDTGILYEETDTTCNVYNNLIKASDDNKKDRASITKTTLSYALNDYCASQKKRFMVCYKSFRHVK